MTAGLAWFESDRSTFLKKTVDEIVGLLASRATQSGLHIEPEQNEEWQHSVGLLKDHLGGRIELIRSALAEPGLEAFREVILEYDFRRRGLRIDCVLLGDGVIAVLEFKRSELDAGDREQVINYCVNLVEFHETTQALCQQGCLVAPVLVLTQGKTPLREATANALAPPWQSILERPVETDASTLSNALASILKHRKATQPIARDEWLRSRFSPSSSIVDAAVSLYGGHDVAAIAAHAAPTERIEACVTSVAHLIERSRAQNKNRIIFVSGAPGAGKTLVGLKLAFDPRFRSDAVFVTGNAPLVEVLSKALHDSYRTAGSRNAVVASGYSTEAAQRVMALSTFKLVKAHQFLGERGKATGSADGSIVIFDEAQRTYAAGREVLRKRLQADEAELILRSLEQSYPSTGAVVVALIGHQQAINTGELGMSAWFRAAQKCGWPYAIGEETLALEPESERGQWETHSLRERLDHAHLPHSLRYYRNGSLERWAGAVLSNAVEEARALASTLAESDTIWLTRSLEQARSWARRLRVGDERAGIIASGQARRLAAEGLFVELKPDMAQWALAPAGDIRSSNMLETVQNQFQIQGLEIDYSILAWDLDLRRVDGDWRSYKISGSKWQTDKYLDVAKNSYRVLLTRARKGMVLFVPRGDVTGLDTTRPPEAYDAIAEYLRSCGAKPLTDR